MSDADTAPETPLDEPAAESARDEALTSEPDPALESDTQLNPLESDTQPEEPAGRSVTTSWDKLTPNQKRAIVAAGAVQVAMLAAAQVDLVRRPTQDVRGPKPAWFAANFVNFVGPVSYFAFGRRRGHGTS